MVNKHFWSIVCLLEWFILYLCRYEYILNPMVNRYDASAINFWYIFLCFLFSNMEGRTSDRLNIVGKAFTSIFQITPFNFIFVNDTAQQQKFPLSIESGA